MGGNGRSDSIDYLGGALALVWRFRMWAIYRGKGAVNLVIIVHTYTEGYTIGLFRYA